MGEGIENIGKPDFGILYAILSISIVFILLLVLRRMMKDKISQSHSAKLSAD